MRAFFHCGFVCLGLLCAGLVSPAMALDKRVDPDPAFLVKARTAATARVEPHYDLVSEKAPFWARFLTCAGNLTAIRDVGQAMPASKDDLDKAIADYRKRAAELLAYRAKTDTKAAPLDADTEITKIKSGAMEFLPADIKKIGVETMTKRASERYTFCQLTRDWYDVQNGAKQETAAADQDKLTAEYEKAMKEIAALSAKPPKVWQGPALKPRVVQPRPVPVGDPLPAQKVIVPPAGSPASSHPKDAILGSDVTNADVLEDFNARPMWSALAECSARMEVVQVKTGDTAKVWISGFVEASAYALWGDREIDKASASVLATKERDRLRARAAAGWDAYRQEHSGEWPYVKWANACNGLEQHAHVRFERLRAARQEKQNREYAEYLKRFNEARAATAVGTETTTGGYYAPSSNNNLAAEAARSRAEHQRNMQGYQDNINRIRSEIRAIDRKYR